jgi:alkylation response protein AidB-like acyl-CoA dehydrogenase
MESLLTAEQLRLREEARAAAEDLVAPGAVARDASCAFPAAEFCSLGERGYLGLTIETAFGGRGLDTVSALLAVTEIAKACASTGLLAGFHALAVGPLLARRGRPEIRQAWLPGLARGELLGALAMTDPPPSADGPAYAFAEGDHVVLRGGKFFVPGAVAADLFLVYARWGDGPSGGGRRRVVLLVPRDTAGLQVGPADAIFGVRAAGVAPVHFNDCRVPQSNVLGDAEDARSLSGIVLAPANLAVAAQAVGIAGAIADKIVARASEREPSGSPIGARQPIQWKLADMQLQLDAARLLSLRAASACDRGDSFAYEALQAKVFAGRAAARIADEAIQVFGGAGSIRDGGVERHWRDAKTTELNPISREAAQLAVSRHLLEEFR